MAGRVRALLLVGALLSAAACTTSEPNAGSPDAPRSSTSLTGRPDQPGGGPEPRRDATLTGRIVDQAGRPVAGLPVTVVEHRSGAGVDAALAAVFTLGIACVATPQTCDGSPRVADSTATGHDGTYSLRLPAAYLPGYETDEDWVVQVGRAPGPGELTGPSSSFELEVNTAVQAAPDLVVWNPAPSITPAGALLRVEVAPVRGGAQLRDPSTQFVDDAGQVVWRVQGTTVDPRVLEDRSTRLVASGAADVEVRHADGRTIYHQSVATPTVAHVGSVRPLSRGAACTAADGGLVGCPFTDGDLTRPTEVGGAVTVDLGAPVEVGLVVVRGSGVAADGEGTLVEGSTDGAVWTRLGHRPLTGAEGWSAGPTTGAGIPAYRYIRVGAGAADLDALAEVSVWAPTAAERAAALGGPSAGEGQGEGGVALAATVAALLVLISGAGTLGVRRRLRACS